ncbi:hypothetical protein L9F63_022513, partial [Diploptera punctata]
YFHERNPYIKLKIATQQSVENTIALMGTLLPPDAIPRLYISFSFLNSQPEVSLLL